MMFLDKCFVPQAFELVTTRLLKHVGHSVEACYDFGAK